MIEFHKLMREIHTVAHLAEKTASDIFFRPYGVTFQQAFILKRLHEKGGEASSLQDLLHNSAKTAGNLTGVIQRMVDQWWITRIQHENDRRKYTIRFSKEGKKMYEKIQKNMEHESKKIKEKFPDIPYERLTHDLAQIKEILSSCTSLTNVWKK